MTDPRGGVLVVDKPDGPTSHDVVAVVRRAFRGLKVGHTGTLDPFATGALPLVIGKATRLARFCADGDKVYEAAIRLGVETDTYDITGTVVFERRDDAAAIGPGQLADALECFRGTRLQTPPPFSAKKQGGVPAYDRARRGERVHLTPVQVGLHEVDVLGRAGSVVRVRLRCSPGYYVRALAHDLGEALGTGGCLESLRRLRSGSFDVADAVTLETVLLDPPRAMEAMLPLESLLPELPAVALTPEGARRVAHGLGVLPTHVAAGPEALTGRARLTSPEGLLLGIAEARPDGSLHASVFLG